MTNLLLRLFVKHPDDTNSPAVRAAVGNLSGITGIVCNLILCALKLCIGVLSGSVSITADAVNNLSDCLSSIVTLLGFRAASKPADRDHPFGHARMEYLAGLAVAMIILVIGVELARSSIQKILHPEPITFSAALVVVLAFSICMKLWMALFNRTLGRRINSQALLATAADSRNDVISTAAVLLACIISAKTGLLLDGYMGLAVALFIIWSGIGIARDISNPLLGAAPEPELVQNIVALVTSHEKVLGIHDLMVHDYGPGRRFASAHVEIDRREDQMLCHDLIDDIERGVQQQLGVHMVIHYDPIVTDDDELTHMRLLVQDSVRSIDPALSIHDFRMVRGHSHTNLIFDLVVPFELADQVAELKQQINQRVQFEDQKYYTVISVDFSAGV